MRLPIKIAARSSPLSQAQVIEVMQNFDIPYETHLLKTSGDIDKKTSLRDLDKTDFFTREVDELVLSQICDIAIHSAKDLPQRLPDGLKIIALTTGKDPRDSLVFNEGIDPSKLKTIATSSYSREQRAKEIATQATFVDIRGTIHERLDQLQKGLVEGVVIAEAALIRLGLNPHRIFLPGESTPLQGRLAIVARTDNVELESLFQEIDSRPYDTAYFGLRCDNPLWHHYPLVKTVPLAFDVPTSATHYIFTSQTAVNFFAPFLVLGKPIFSIGKATQRRLRELGFESKVAAKEQLEGMIELLSQEDLSQAELCWPRSDLSRDLLSNWFKEKNIRMTEIPLYTTESLDVPKKNFSKFKRFFFTSPSTVDAYLKAYDSLPCDKEICAIGPITQKKINSCF